MDPDAVSSVGRATHGGSTAPLDFSANTNPVRPPGVTAVYDAAFAEARRYPDDSYTEFREAAAATVDCDPAWVVPTSGGTEAIRLALSTTVRAGESVLVPTPSFAEYEREARLQGAHVEQVAHDELLDASVDDHAAVVLCTPNNPTGEATPPERIEEFAARCRDADTVLVVDEAFLDFTTLDSVAGVRGVVVCRSLTKLYGLPGLRMGFAVARDDLYDRLETARPAWNVSAPAAAVGSHCLRQQSFVDAVREQVDSERERMRGRLVEMGYEPAPSDAPFLLLDVGTREVDSVVDGVREHGIAVRDCRSFGLDSHVRVAVKRPHENDRLLEALSRV